MSKESLGQRTIRDFGTQWTTYRDNEGYYASVYLFNDIFRPLILAGELRDAHVADIGGGTGRTAAMLLEAGVAEVTAVEPSDAFDVLEANLSHYGDRVKALRATGDRLPPTGDLDYVFSIGVIHHIPEPLPVAKAALGALKPGGTFAIWVYGWEGNGAYLAFTLPLRILSRILPHALLTALVRTLDLPLGVYIRLCRSVKLPLSDYINRVLGRLDGQARRLVIYDQLNPAYAKYYTRKEVEALMTDAGFEEVRLLHRHNYSWTAVGKKPVGPTDSP